MPFGLVLRVRNAAMMVCDGVVVGVALPGKGFRAWGSPPWLRAVVVDGCSGRGQARSGRASSRWKARASSAAQGQFCWRRSRVTRPLRARRPAQCQRQ